MSKLSGDILKVGLGIVLGGSAGYAIAESNNGSASASHPAAVVGKPFKETVQFAANGFKDFLHASGESSTRTVVGHVVTLQCVAYGPESAAPSTFGFWYEDATPGPLDGLYIAANTFTNDSNLGLPLDKQNAVDPRYRNDLCEGSQPPHQI